MDMKNRASQIYEMEQNTKESPRSRARTVNAFKRKPKRIVLIGSTKCGKTSLIRRFVHDTFTDDYTPTIEDCHSYQYTYRKLVWNLDIIDLCAPFMFPVMRDLNIKSAHIILFVYDIGNDKSLQELVKLTPKIKELRPNGVTTVIVGTKIDSKLDAQVSIRHGPTQSLLNEVIADTKARHILASSKSDIGVKEVFEFCLSDYMKNYPTSLPHPDDDEISDDVGKDGRHCCSIS